jgi:cysteine desulfurase
VPEARVIGASLPRLPNTSAIAFPGVSGEALLIRLDLEGVAVSVGSACSSGTVAPSPALLALGLSAAQAKSVVRFSLSRWTTPEEIGRTVPIVSTAVCAMSRLEAAPA